MDKKVKQILETEFDIPSDEGPDKVLPLAEAIKQNIHPGQQIHMGMATDAAVREIIRQFYGTTPGFTLIAEFPFFGPLNLIHCGLVEKIICAGVGEGRKPRPSPTINKALRENKLQIESYSLASFIQRLMAGAIAGFMPTVSLAGSTMAESHTHSFKMIDDPFDSGRKVGVIKGINPDISIMHAWAADRSGNAIVLPHHFTAEETWGAWASRSGAVLTTERIVSTDFIRKHNILVNIPQYMVRSVSLAPLGAHPEGIMNWGFCEFDAYEYDYDFIDARQDAVKNGKLDEWIREWILDCPCEEDYLHKLGPEKIAFLRGKANSDHWKWQAAAKAENISASEHYVPRERMVVMASRKIVEKVIERDYKTILSGGGVASLSAWLGHRNLRKQGHDAEIVVGSGQIGFTPLPGDPFITNFTSMATCKMITNGVNCYQVFIGGENKRSLSVLGCAQIDKFGNINSAQVPTAKGNIYLTGAGGGGDACKAREVMVVIEQSRQRFVEKVSYITSSGEPITTLVSTLGIFEKLGDDQELVLTGYFYNPKMPSAEEAIRHVKDNCGWDLKISPQVKQLPEPTVEELIRLRLLDPDGEYIT
ncbi:MAG: CoA-transferase [Chloroflexota bacterium]|nr:CoA-transferase [Chloroflexota bacterium]